MVNTQPKLEYLDLLSLGTVPNYQTKPEIFRPAVMWYGTYQTKPEIFQACCWVVPAKPNLKLFRSAFTW